MNLNITKALVFCPLFTHLQNNFNIIWQLDNVPVRQTGFYYSQGKTAHKAGQPSDGSTGA